MIRRGRAHEELRYQAVYVHPQTVAAFFDVATIPRDEVHVPCFKDLPIGYEIVDVHWDQMRNCFVFVIFHPTFRALGEHEQTPIIELRAESVRLERKVESDRKPR